MDATEGWRSLGWRTGPAGPALGMCLVLGGGGTPELLRAQSTLNLLMAHLPCSALSPSQPGPLTGAGELITDTL